MHFEMGRCGTLTAMSKGLGVTQKAILGELIRATVRDENHLGPVTVMDLSRAIGRSDRQIRTAVRALEKRGLVNVMQCNWDTGISLVAYLCYEMRERMGRRYGWEYDL